jgi:hypothetical protein
MAVTKTQLTLAGPWHDLRVARMDASRRGLALDLVELWS